MDPELIKTIVVGSLNTDIIANQVNKLASSGEQSSGRSLQIKPGGKARNIAQMTATLSEPYTVAMIGRSCKDPFNLWKAPIDSLIRSKVNTNYLKILKRNGAKEFPGVALIAVDSEGRNQIYTIPGVNDDLSIEDVNEAEILFQYASKNDGTLVTSLEVPLETALGSIDLANKYSLRVLVDPGGVAKGRNYSELINKEIYLFKPNEHEAEILSGVKVKDFKSAEEASKHLKSGGIENVLITHGKNGAYFFNGYSKMHFPISNYSDNRERNETGCGDQTISTISAQISKGIPLEKAIGAGVVSGTMQFYKKDIQPITLEELARAGH